MSDKNTPIISAHRGGREEAPENTMAAFEYAADLGIPGAECDVLLSADEVPVIIHDDTVDRTTNGTGEVHTLTVEQLAELDARAVHTNWPTAPHVPAFTELMAMADRFDYIEVEIKADDPERIRKIVPKIHEEIARSGANDKVRIITFVPEIIQVSRSIAPDMMHSLIVVETTDTEIAHAVELGCDGIAGWVQTLSEEFVTSAHEKGLKVTCWTVNSDEDFDNMLAWGVDVITTDRPKHMRDRLSDQRTTPSA